MRGKGNWRVNEQIRAPKLRLINEKGKAVGVVTREEALKKIKDGLDLVEIAPMAKPPVAKLTDFGKFVYEQEKKERKQRKKSKAADVKEVRLSPFIAENDYQTRKSRIKEFLENGHKIRVVVKFKGKQMGSKTFGYKLLDRVLDDFKEAIGVDMQPKFLGRHLIMVISPVRKKSVKKEDAETKNEKVD